MMSRLLLPFLFLAVFVGCEPSRQGANVPTPPEELADPTAPETGNSDPEAPATFQVAFDTTEGEVVIDVDRSLAPRGADRFYRLVKEGFYDGAKFFRVLPGFVAQVGMAADPAVHAKWGEANFRDDPVKGSNTPGTVTFAKRDVPHSRSTQLFINYGDNSGSLDPQGFAPFGRVTKGMEAVEKFYSEYGERPDQQRIAAQGNEYLDAEFPELDAIKTARVISENGEPVAEGDTKAAATDDAEAAAPASTEEPAPAPTE